MDLKIFYNRYQILKKIGEGGLGSVFLAQDLWSEKEVALKLLSDKKASLNQIKLFQKEFQLLRYLKHPGLVEVYDLFKTEDRKVGYSMEFVPGKVFLENKKILDLKSFYFLALQICQTLDFIHSQGLIHCDLKPQNFLISHSTRTKKESDFEIKLMDFGLAGVLKENDQKVKGTVGYIAPEILRGEKFDQRADLYSLGVIFYQALTGQLPFNHTDPAVLIAAQLEQKPVSPDKINPKVSPPLAELILKLLEIDPPKRFFEVWEVQRILEKLSKSKVEENFFSYYLESGQPLGLARPLRVLKQTLKSGNHSLFLLTGEKGAGKTAFLQQVKIMLQAQGYLALEIKSDKKSSPTESLRPAWKTIIDFLQERYPQRFFELGPDIKSIWGTLSDRGKKKPKAQVTPPDLTDIIITLQKLSDLIPLALLIDGLDDFNQEGLRFLKTAQNPSHPESFIILATCAPEFLEGKDSLSGFLKREVELEKAQLLILPRLNFHQTSRFIQAKLPPARPAEKLSGQIGRA